MPTDKANVVIEMIQAVFVLPCDGRKRKGKTGQANK